MAKAAEETVYWTRAGVIIGSVGTIFLLLNLYYVRRSTDAAVESVKIANKTYIAEHRTWLNIYPVEVGPVTFEGDKIRVRVTLEAENVGKFNATNVHLRCEAFRAIGYSVGREAVENLIAEEIAIRTRFPSYGMIVMPTKKTPRWGFSTDAAIDTATTAKAEQQIALGAKLRRVTLSVVYCVFYKTLASDDWWYSVHVAVLVKVDGTEFDPALGDVPPSNIRATNLPGESQMT